MLLADEVIISSSASICMVVSEIDGKAVGGKDPERLRQLQDAVYADFYKETDSL